MRCVTELTICHAWLQPLSEDRSVTFSSLPSVHMAQRPISHVHLEVFLFFFLIISLPIDFSCRLTRVGSSGLTVAKGFSVG